MYRINLKNYDISRLLIFRNIKCKEINQPMSKIVQNFFNNERN